MFEREIKFIYDFNLNKVNRLGPYLTFEQLATTEIHPAILQYVSAEIDYLVFEDRQNLLKKSVFDYSGEKITFHFNQITDELKKSKRFAVEYIAKLILHASSFSVNYLIRPKWTLAKFVFDEEKHKTSNEIKQILNYVYYYKYLTKILSSYINTKKILSMDLEEFEILLNKADSIGVENYLPAILDNALKSMAEFFNIGEIKKNRIPLPAVELFLEEKDLLNHLNALNETFGEDENARFNLADYRKVLSSVMFEKEEPKIESIVYPQFEAEKIEEPEEENSFNTGLNPEPGSGPVETGNAPALSSDEYMDNYKDGSRLERNEIEIPDEIPGTKEEDELPDEETEELIDREKEETGTAEIIAPGEKIIINPNPKLRIHIENGTIEPVFEETDTPPENNSAAAPANDIGSSEKMDESDIDPYKRFNEIMTIGPGGFAETPIEQKNDPGEEEPHTEIEKEKRFSFNETEINKELSLSGLTEAVDKPEEENDTPESVEPKDFASLLLEADARLESNGSDSFKIPSEPDGEIGEKNETEETEESMFDVIRKNTVEKEEKKAIDLAEVLEHKEMSKIIQVVFDYDIEDFASALDAIANCKNAGEAQMAITGILDDRRINLNSREAEAFRSIILDFFDRL